MEIKCKLCDKIVILDQNLTTPQLKAQKFIQNFFKKNNKTPSFREIQKGLGYKTPSAASQLVDALVDKQYLAKREYRSRSLIILKEVPCA